MLTFFRRRMKIILWIVTVFIIVAFIPWGAGVRRMRGEKDLGKAGELFGKNVSRAELDETRIAIQGRQALFQGRTPITEDQINKQAWEHLTMYRQARRQGITVSDKELAGTIRRQFGGQTGAFDQRLYENILRSVNLTPALYEDFTRQALMMNKLREQARLSAWLPDEELERKFREEETKLTIAYALTENAAVEKSVAVSDEEAKKYYTDHQNEFTAQPTVNVRYLLIPIDKAAASGTPTAADIKKYYDENPGEFSHGKRLHISQILFKIDRKDPAKGDAKAKKEAEDVIALLKKGKDFRKLAGKYSQDDATRKKGGDLGFVEEGKLQKPLSDKAFSMKEGEFSEPVKAGQGYYIIKVEKIQEAGTKPFDEVKNELEARLGREKKDQAVEEAKQAAYTRAVDISLALVDNAKAEAVAAKYSLTIKETGPFAEKDTVKEIGMNPDFNKAAFATEAGSFSDVIEIPDKGYCIILPKEKTEASPKPFEAARAEIIKELKEEKAKKQAHETAISQRAAAEKKMEEGKMDFAAAVKALSIKTQETKPFTAQGFIPELGYEPAVATVAGSLKPGALSNVIDIKKGSLFLSLLKREEPAEKELAKGSEMFKRRAMGREEGKIVAEWNRWVHDQAKHVDYTTLPQITAEGEEE